MCAELEPYETHQYKKTLRQRNFLYHNESLVYYCIVCAVYNRPIKYQKFMKKIGKTFQCSQDLARGKAGRPRGTASPPLIF